MRKGEARVLVALAVFGLSVLIPLRGNGADITANGNLTVNGTLVATSFTGDGSGLTGVEKRTPISACGTISQSGSYYLTQNLSTTGTCITVTANDVTIDLGGFGLTGNGSAPYGIYWNASTVSNVEVRNGTIRNFAIGIMGDYGLLSSRVINVRAIGNGDGIGLAGNGSLVKDCTVTDSKGSYGIYATLGSTVTGNTVYNNQGIGIDTDSGVTVTGNTVYKNKSSGIYAGDGVTVMGNTVYNNQEDGIQAGSGSTVTNNTVYANNQSNQTTYAGIEITSGCIVKNNTLRSNLQNNIRVDGSDNAIEENLLTISGNGIIFYSSGNFYANNRASGNTTNYNTNGNAQTDGGGNVAF